MRQVYLTLLLITLLASSSCFKKHLIMDRKSEHSAQQLIQVFDKKHQETQINSCLIVAGLQCVQNSLPAKNDADLADQIVQLSQLDGEDPQVIMQTMQSFFMNSPTSGFWQCLLASEVGGCADEDESIYTFKPVKQHLRSQQKAHLVVFTTKIIKNYRNSIQKHNADDGEVAQAKCAIENVLKTVQSIDQSLDQNIADQVMAIFSQEPGVEEEQMTEEEEQQLMGQFVGQLICDGNTGDFWKSLITNVVSCYGQKLDLSGVQC